MNWRATEQTQRAKHFTPVPSGLLQRACACGQHTASGGECAECRKKRESTLQRAAVSSEPAGAVPPIVHEVLRSPGQPLDAANRAALEPRFGHDFSGVRVHTGAQASESARAVNALAYTVGRDVVFGTGQYAPGTSAGQRLLAHELTHVVQQGNHSSSMPMPSSISGIFDPLEDEAEEVAAQVVAGQAPTIEHAAGEAGTIYRAPLVPPLVELRDPIQATSNMAAAMAASCGRTTPLTWSDFAGNAPARSQFSAETHFHFEQATSGNSQIVRAMFDSGPSWVRSIVANAANRVQNGGAGQVRSCERFFDTLKPGQTGWRNIGPPQGCVASAAADPSARATSRAECSTVLGAEWDRVAQLESQRLLRHEQGHFDLACAIARKGTLAILGGAAPDQTLRQVQATANAQTLAYDRQTIHGCNAGAQAQWEQDIQAGLPGVSLNPPAPARRRRP